MSLPNGDLYSRVLLNDKFNVGEEESKVGGGARVRFKEGRGEVWHSWDQDDQARHLSSS